MMRPSVQFDGSTLSPAEVERIATSNADVSISTDAWHKVETARSVVDGILERGETVYGINTGFGALVDQRISPEDLAQLQTNLIRSHATALGEPMSRASVRAMMAVRINSLVKGHSGVHPDVLKQLIAFLNNDIVPFVPRIGSLGASGDLAPLSHMALALIGEGMVLDEHDSPVPTDGVLKEHGLIGIGLRAKDGLSLINGTSQMLAFMTLAERRLNSLLPLADMILCTSMEARKASVQPSDQRVHRARPHPGQSLVAERIRALMKDSPILESHADCDRVQDAYSFRCAPQVHGAVLQRYSTMAETLNIELNSATDNPLIFPDPKNPGPHEVISQGNFHGEVIALAADSMSAALFELASISERRIDQMLDPARSQLPAFLAKDSGLESGLMIVQYVAGASLAELHGHATPRAAFSTSTSAGQEDHVSMGATAAWNLLEATQRLSEVLACELFVACEALEFESLPPSPYVLALKQRVRTLAKPLDGDRTTSSELIQIAEALSDGAWLARIEAEVGRIPR